MSCTVALAEELLERARSPVASRRVFNRESPAPSLFDLPPQASRRWATEIPIRHDEDAERWDGLS